MFFMVIAAFNLYKGVNTVGWLTESIESDTLKVTSDHRYGYRLRYRAEWNVIAHRLKTIENVDRILVINGDDLIESGTHDELLQKRGFYLKSTTASSISAAKTTKRSVFYVYPDEKNGCYRRKCRQGSRAFWRRKGIVEQQEGFIDATVMVKKVRRGDEVVIVMIRWESEDHWKQWKKSEAHIAGHKASRGKRSLNTY